MLVALAGVVLIMGAGFLYAYDTLRSERVTFGTPAFAGESTSLSADGLAPPPGLGANNEEYQDLLELGIDPETTSLSPEARAAIVRAHRAARTEGTAAAADASPSN
ncbi:hypothetical protein B5C34_14290 [Pacificimonas flava]|uniref:Uncharacterized protein n=1 Tax=Pacificimonas flava TaxID=1234595 RepID=A0A219B8B4_9SPHN|nr:hypothetical protein B5C34_14290 [Pacificimonas flava]